MIRHIFKLIWAERRVNTWIMAELILVFCILWFCTDYLSTMAKRYMEPKGFDMEYTYHLKIGMKDEAWQALMTDNEEKLKDMAANLWTIYDRVKQYPAIEQASYSRYAAPYNQGTSSGGVIIDSFKTSVYKKFISPEFFETFKIGMLSGTPFTWDNVVVDNQVIIVPDGDGKLLDNHSIDQLSFLHYEGSDIERKVIGMANKIKYCEYEDYIRILYQPVKKGYQNVVYLFDLCVRVKPGADNDFTQRFMKEMSAQFEEGPYFLAAVIPMERYRQDYLNRAEYDSNFKSIYSVSAFLIINIFLGVIGTFWFRIQSRRGEIGLRVALGASKSKVKSLFIGETVLLLFLASIVATALCANISATDILQDIGVPVIDRGEAGTGITQYLINYGFTFAFLAVIAVVAVWYPAKKASDLPPTEALRDE